MFMYTLVVIILCFLIVQSLLMETFQLSRLQPIELLLSGCRNKKVYEDHRERFQSLAELKNELEKFGKMTMAL